jgi:hypothetical protein
MTDKNELAGLPEIAIQGAAAAAREVAAGSLSDARELEQGGSQYQDGVGVHQRVAVAAASVAQKLDQLRNVQRTVPGSLTQAH